MTLKPHMIRESFHKTSTKSFNLKQIVNKLRGDPVSQAATDTIAQSLDALVFHINGELFEEHFDAYGIRPDAHQTARGKATEFFINEEQCC